jgi:hypothetical protein
MKNALDMIGNPSPLKKYHRNVGFGKVTNSRFIEPLLTKGNVKMGKKACSRDGHSACLYNNKLIIFGGDR